MKQIFLLPAIWLLAQCAFAQSSLQQFIDDHKTAPQFTYAYLSKDLFEVTIKTDVDQKDWNKLHQVIQNLGSLSILVADSIDHGLQLYKEAFQGIAKDEMDELLSVQDGSDRVRIWVNEENGTLTNLVLLVGTSSEFVLVCFNGNLELKNIMELAGMFEAADARSLAQSAQEASIQFSVFPNPSKGQVTITYQAADDRPEMISVFDQNGRVISTRNLDGSASQALDFSQLSTGNYWFQMKTKGGKVGVTQVQITK